MARKTLANLDPQLRKVTEEFEAVSIVKNEMATDAYNVQDKETQAAIDRITATLQQHATGYITPKVGNMTVPVKIDNEYIGYNLFYLAVEIVKDLAFVGIRVGNFVFPPAHCVNCGAEFEPEPPKKGRRRG